LLKEKDYNLSQIKKSEIEEVAKTFNHFEIEVEKLDGFDKAEVTRGGISVDEIFPKTMEARKCSGLYFIGEALDVTGMLGGYNLHWAWASAKMFIDGLDKK
jgi:predicted flavoprotein YhiN